MSSFRIGFDIGGTKIAAILLAPDGTALTKQRWPVASSYPAFLEQIISATQEFDRQAGAIARLGLGVAGVIDHRQGVVRRSKLEWLQEQNLVQDLTARLARPVRIANDADCFAVSEAVDGAGDGYDHVFGAIIGTGAGGAQVVGRKLVTGVNGTNGEWGHVPLPHYQASDGAFLPCHCGQTGCIETFVSGPGLARLYHFMHGSVLSAPEIAIQAAAGNGAALATLERFYHQIAKAMSLIVMCLDPEAIIIGGGLKDLPGLYPALHASIPRYCLIKELQTAILPAMHDDDSGVRGAAWL